MGPKKKDLTPIGKGGITKHAGKGSSFATPTNPNSTMNDYAKATPMAQPSTDSDGGAMGPYSPSGM